MPQSVSVSLSHYCPTAAAMLFREDAAFELIEGPAAFPEDWPFEGLDARNSYSPLLRPGVLLGFDGLEAFEEASISTLSEPDALRGLDRLAAAVETARQWTPASGPLIDLIHGAFKEAAGSPDRGAEDPTELLQASLARGTPPPPTLPRFRNSTLEILPFTDLALRRYLAARLIASWIMFQGSDLRSVTRYLGLCLDAAALFAGGSNLVDERGRWTEGFRMADLWLLHHCDPDRLAQNLG